MHMGKMWQRFAAANVPAMITVYTNKDGYTRNSVRVDEDGYVAVYDKTCTRPEITRCRNQLRFDQPIADRSFT